MLSFFLLDIMYYPHEFLREEQLEAGRYFESTKRSEPVINVINRPSPPPYAMSYTRANEYDEPLIERIEPEPAVFFPDLDDSVLYVDQDRGESPMWTFGQTILLSSMILVGVGVVTLIVLKATHL